LPQREERPHGVRDVCLGFCYDPVATLGFTVRPQRARLQTPDELSLGMAALERWDMKEAILRLERAVSLDPRSPIAHQKLTLAYEWMCGCPERCDPRCLQPAIRVQKSAGS